MLGAGINSSVYSQCIHLLFIFFQLPSWRKIQILPQHSVNILQKVMGEEVILKCESESPICQVNEFSSMAKFLTITMVTIFIVGRGRDKMF